MTLSDIVIFSASAIAFYSAALLWIRYTEIGTKLFDFSQALSSKVAIRIAFLHVAVAAVCCIVGKMSGKELAFPLFVYLIAVLLSLLLLQKTDTLLSFEPSLVVLFPALAVWLSAWAIGSFVLAPARRPVEYNPETSQLSFPPLPITDGQIENETIVVVVSPLRPFGYVELDGQRMPARCIDNGFVETGEEVRVYRRAGQTIVVKRNASDN